MTYEPVYTRTPRNAFVPSPVFVGIVAVFVVSGVMTWTKFGNVGFDVFLFVISGWIISLCLHEYAHAITGYFSGDLTVADRGYLRLNPLKYTHPLLSIVLPVIVVILGGIGLPGGAVWIDHRYIRSKVKDSLISAAGPLTNVLLALVVALPFLIGLAPEVVTFRGQSALTDDSHLAFWAALALLAFLQVTASVLNFLPVPGLDGGSIISPWFSPAYQRAWNLMAPWGFLVLFLLLWQSPAGTWFFQLVDGLAGLLGIDSALYGTGLRLMRFWS
ncbi:site-2 protease family protein [Actinoplanes philippinensis]|uniref:Zn-dependent protease (Includes SpoIVFB) n=1 Tax=Actinoplanes philippinensis TaxID=35752 RepID=A0A1I2BTP7_9ACTN|nr:site-2 protease family protein [Actinoplanes philippinensis]GIE76105.1 site-2 protease family protein [Actinoplanes philippinensis]SFE59415.1 Zn-dependent protease (includes SpoIVFB) [Actinoplanes philippinensis]